MDIFFALFLLEYPVLNICLTPEKNYPFNKWLQKFQNKTWTIAWTTDSWFSLSEFHSSYEHNSKLWIHEKTNTFDISICLYTYMQYRHNHYYNKVSYYWHYCGVSLKFDSNKMKYPGIFFIPNYICFWGSKEELLQYYVYKCVNTVL